MRFAISLAIVYIVSYKNELCKNGVSLNMLTQHQFSDSGTHESTHISIPLQSDIGQPIILPKLKEGECHPILAAIQEFQSWLLNIKRKNLVSKEPSGDKLIVRLSEDVSRRFCLGVAEERIFLGIQPLEMRWFQGLPWLHVAIKKGSKSLNLVGEETTLDGITLPYFAIALCADNSEKFLKLIKTRYLDVREISLD